MVEEEERKQLEEERWRQEKEEWRRKRLEEVETEYKEELRQKS